MHHDVDDLRRFYYQRALGRVAQRILRDRLTARWRPESCKGMTIAGFGFPVPMLRPYLAPARRVTGLMPAPQGVMPWPAARPNCSVLCDETSWPIETGSLDRLVMLHGLETSDDPAALLREAWRALGPGGRMIIMVPNRAGLWAASDGTPFGLGRSYTVGQLEAQTLKAGFVTEWYGSAIYIPPSSRRFWLRSAQMWERTGAKISRLLIAGIVLIEISKQTRGPIGPGAKVQIPSPMDILDGVKLPRPARSPTARMRSLTNRNSR